MPILLKKNEPVVIANDKGTPVMDITVGARWGKINHAGKSEAASFVGRLLGKIGAGDAVLESVDLDLSIVCFAGTDYSNTCYFGQRQVFGGAITHTGDDLTGSDESDGISDNERIKFRGLNIPANVTTAFIVLNSFRHHKFDEIPFIGFAIYDGLYNLGDKAPALMEFTIHNDKHFAGAEAAVMGRIDRTAKGWVVTPLSQPTSDSGLTGLRSTCAKLLG